MTTNNENIESVEFYEDDAQAAKAAKAAKIRAAIIAQERPLLQKVRDFFTMRRVTLAIGALSLIAIGAVLGKLGDFVKDNKDKLTLTPPVVEAPITEEVLEIPPVTEEVYVVEDIATTEDKAIATQHADERSSIQLEVDSLRAQVAELNDKITAITKTVNSGGGLITLTIPDGSAIEKRVSLLAREQVQLYKLREDNIAKRKGWRNYITWKDLN